MSNRILQLLLVVSTLLVAIIFFFYKSYGWPFGREGVEAIGAFLIFGSATFFYYRFLKQKNIIQQKGVSFGLLFGVLWTLEISMNNLLRPGLPQRDIYDDIFWAIIAFAILALSFFYAFKSKKILVGILIGLWSGFASGVVAGFTALVFIVFGMIQILQDQLNITEWAALGKSSGAPSMAVYFAYQTLAGAVLHLLVLGILMGGLVGIIGGLFGWILQRLKR